MRYINEPNIILGIANPLDPENFNNQIILISKYYLYKCRCLGDKPSINVDVWVINPVGGIKYLKYCIEIEKTKSSYHLHNMNIHVYIYKVVAIQKCP
jgi:hypothetical protein